MAYTVFGGTLSLTQSILQVNHGQLVWVFLCVLACFHNYGMFVIALDFCVFSVCCCEFSCQYQCL